MASLKALQKNTNLIELIEKTQHKTNNLIMPWPSVTILTKVTPHLRFRSEQLKQLFSIY
ncbi:MAG: hypothetical protein ACI9LE_001437 [Paraglaciecola sp.]|jgi:hypothetical protein